MNNNNRVGDKIEIEKTELEATMHMVTDEFKSETVIFIDIKLTALSSNKQSFSYDQPSDDIVKWRLLKSF